MRVSSAIIIALAFFVSCTNTRQQAPAVVHAADRPAKWIKNEIPLTVYVHEARGYGYASAEGFWQSTSADKDKQLAFPLAANITCLMEEKVCREADATVQLGLLKADSVEYEITSWTKAGIVAEEADSCNRHSLAINFKTNSVTVTDYPIKAESSSDVTCKPLHEAYSYTLHGGQFQLFPPAPWDPLEKKNGN